VEQQLGNLILLLDRDSEQILSQLKPRQAHKPTVFFDSLDRAFVVFKRSTVKRLFLKTNEAEKYCVNIQRVIRKAS
jgi:hypothetical protein